VSARIEAAALLAHLESATRCFSRRGRIAGTTFHSRGLIALATVRLDKLEIFATYPEREFAQRQRRALARTPGFLT